jgi:cytochrome c
MNRFAYRFLLIGLFLPILTAGTLPAKRPTRSEAKAMLTKAVAYYKSVGRKQALADFTAEKPPFRDRDLYVLCVARDGRIVADGGFPQYLGVSANALVDVGGKGLGDVAWQVASAEDMGATQYRWVNPLTRDLEIKTMFFAKVGDDVCGVGAYGTQ